MGTNDKSYNREYQRNYQRYKRACEKAGYYGLSYDEMKELVEQGTIQLRIRAYDKSKTLTTIQPPSHDIRIIESVPSKKPSTVTNPLVINSPTIQKIEVATTQINNKPIPYQQTKNYNNMLQLIQNTLNGLDINTRELIKDEFRKQNLWKTNLNGGIPLSDNELIELLYDITLNFPTKYKYVKTRYHTLQHKPQTGISLTRLAEMILATQNDKKPSEV